MIRKRNNPEGISTTSKSTQIDTEKQEEDVSTWREQAIKVLNILDSQGINIYDKGRTPGMYLRRDKFSPNYAELNASSRVFEALATKNTVNIDTTKDKVKAEAASYSEIPSGLLAFFEKQTK